MNRKQQEYGCEMIPYIFQATYLQKVSLQTWFYLFLPLSLEGKEKGF